MVFKEMAHLREVYRRYKEILFPKGTRRRKIYDLIRKGISVIENQGFRGFFKKLYLYFNPLHFGKIKVKNLVIPSEEHKIIEKIKSKISVIIPTKNAGRDFEYLLQRLRTQKGVSNLEIVIIDSGSEDSTIEVGKRYSDILLTIPPDEFSHSKTRNLAADSSTGEYLLFLSQDVIPADDLLIHDMIRILNSESKIGAVTCRQIPRSDADLKAIFDLYSYYEHFKVYNDLIVSVDNIDSLNSFEKRRISQIANICCLIRKSTFQNYKFRGEYGEDLDLGLRLLRDGYKLCYLYSHAVIHSHNRSCLYFFKANYKDRRTMSNILNQESRIWNFKDYNLFLLEIKRFYLLLKNFLFKYVPDNNMGYINSNELEDIINKFYKLTGNLTHFDNIPKDEFYNFLTYIQDNYKEERVLNEIYENKLKKILNNDFFELLQRFIAFLKIYEPVESEEVKTALLKLFGSLAGVLFGDFISYLYKEENMVENLRSIDEIIFRGV